VLFTSILFFIGVAFGYYVILPTSVLFLAQFILFEEAENIWRIGDVINFELTVLFGTGMVFQLPLVVYYLSLIGMVTPAFLRKYRRHSIVILLTIAAIITPSPDPFSQLLVFTPLMILYELSIIISRRVEKRKLAEEAEEKLKDEKAKAAAQNASEPETEKTEE
jgi:sec-independent protein translocase protein TatC